MVQKESNRWRVNRRVDISVFVQLVLLAGLIVTSWLNLQRRLDGLTQDVERLLEQQKQAAARMERLTERCIGYEYRLRAMEAMKQ